MSKDKKSGNTNILMHGSGLTMWQFSYDEKKLEIDFTGAIIGDQCYRNDASILFFAANSYLSSYYIIKNELKNRFENGDNEKRIGHLIMPFNFCFRHFIELNLKALIATITHTKPDNIHELLKLTKKLGEVLCSLKDENITEFVKENLKHFDSNKEKVTNIFEELRVLIEKYDKEEPAVEYFRYLFETNYTLRNPYLSLDYNKIIREFSLIEEKFKVLCMQLREMGVYVYWTL